MYTALVGNVTNKHGFTGNNILIYQPMLIPVHKVLPFPCSHTQKSKSVFTHITSFANLNLFTV